MKKSGILSIILTILAALICILLIMDSEGMISAAKNSVTVCLNVIIPSLFAFMVFSQLIVSSKAAEILFYPFYLLSRFWFKGTVREFGIFMLSLLGGYPVGIKLLKQEIAYNKNYPAIAEKMLCFCYCGSPAFIIQVAGLSVLGSSKAGLLVYLSNVLACFSAAVILNISQKRSDAQPTKIRFPINFPKVRVTLSDVTDSINSSVKALGVICGTILAFNIMLELLNFSGFLSLLENFGANKIFSAALEISNLSQFGKESYSLLPLFAALTSFGGLCIIMQTAALSNGAVPLGKFIFWRIPIAALSALYCYILTRFIPISIETASAVQSIPVLSSVNPICSVCLIVMTFILFNVQNKDKKRI